MTIGENDRGVRFRGVLATQMPPGMTAGWRVGFRFPRGFQRLVLSFIQMIQAHLSRHARPCAGHPRKPRGGVPQFVYGRDKPAMTTQVNRLAEAED
jgi:hypothetical protein